MVPGDLRVAVLYSPAARELLEKDARAQEHTDNMVNAVIRVLRHRGYPADMVPSTPEGFDTLARGAFDVVFNLATGMRSKKEQANIVAILELLGIPFTGPGLAAHIVCLHKHITKRVLASCGVPTSPFRVYHTPDGVGTDLPDLPAIVKPANEGSSAGIGPGSIAGTRAEVIELVDRITKEFSQPALVESFLPGREFTLAVLGNKEPLVLAPEEIVFDERAPGFYTHEVKVRDQVTPVCPANVDPDLARALETAARDAYLAAGCRGYARVDIRLDASGKPNVLEINSLPGLEPGYSEFPRIAAACGLAYEDLIVRILEYAIEA
ncbi:MAG TPA: hypothetical protein GX506_09675 [Firmicutes bacterium]|nr:hypothetical protein [Bacillota bacterium]